MIALEPTVAKLRHATRSFLDALRERDFERVWNDLISSDSAKVLSATLYPLIAYENGKIDALFTSAPDVGISMSTSDLLSLAFQVDAESARSGLFEGFANGLVSTGWYEFYEDKCIGFVEEPAAVLFAQTPIHDLLMMLIQGTDGIYRVDMVAMVLFSMRLRASVIYEIAERALELRDIKSAVAYYELVSGLAEPFKRLERLTWGHPVAHIEVNEDRKQELQEEQHFVERAKSRLDELLAGPKVASVQIDMARFLASTFRGYTNIPRIKVTEEDVRKLTNLKDGDLRQKVASILIGVDPVAAQREADKPHGPSEIADMEVSVEVEGKKYYLCMPFKSGQEIKQPVVGVGYAFQLDRPFLEFQNAIVVFVTAKPCSQPLHNRIKKWRDKLGYAIEVIEGEQLAALLKTNKLLK